MKGQGKTNRTSTSVKCKSRLLASSSSNTNRKLRSRKAIHRKSRKPSNLPCSMNECHAVEENGDEQEQYGGAATADSSADADVNVDAGAGGTSGGTAAVKTIETALEGDTQPRMSENLIEVAADVNEARKKAEAGDDSDTKARGGVVDSDDASSSSELSDSGDEDEGAVGKGGRVGKYAKDDQRKKNKKQRVRHIHPCICDLSTKAQARIKAHIREREIFETRHAKRLESIDAELRAIEEEIARKQQEEEEQQELFGDKYEIVGKKKKRMKRSARRASMVSLGVKQVINWKKSPRIKVRHNQVSSLRKNFTAYCGDRPIPLREIKKIGFEQSPKLPVRVTKAASLRGEFNAKKMKFLIDSEDKRPVFNLSPYY